jgi:hypothetical protein
MVRLTLLITVNHKVGAVSLRNMSFEASNGSPGYSRKSQKRTVQHLEELGGPCSLGNRYT